MVELTPNASTPVSTSRCDAFLVRLAPEARQSPNWPHMRRDLVRLGGTPVADGFVFDCAATHAVAIDILGDKYGSRYFESAHP